MWYLIGTALLSLAVIMADWCLDAFTPARDRGLAPSQLLVATLSRKTKKPAASKTSNLLVPSQVMNGRNCVAQNADTSESEAVQSESEIRTLIETPSVASTANSIRRNRRQRRPKQPAVNKKKATIASFPATGNLPDIFWRAVPMDHLREHPRFVPLPQPEFVAKLSCLEDARLFQQGSWQWDALHNGRCTTSQAVAALGFLEPTAAEVLGVPTAWRRGGGGAFHRLGKPALRTLDEMNAILCEGAKANSTPIDEVTDLWDDDDVQNTTFFARYLHETDDEEIKERTEQLRRLGQGDYLDKAVRLLWGNTQEATALLTAINYFTKTDKKVVLKEVGMCGAGLDLNQTDLRSSLLIGATPDGVLHYDDGSIEAVEVKNHCPFYSNRGRKRNGGNIKRFSVGNWPWKDTSGVFSQYIPQLQMEMLCLGTGCRSAVMVRQSATNGALILRMKRDDEWIEEMLYWLHRFQCDYVEAKKAPPRDFFWDSPEKMDRSRYRRFVNRTAEIRNAVKLVAEIPNDQIQRVEEDAPMFLD